MIGWESVSYTAFEGDQGSETICLVVENDKVLGESAILAINGSNFGEGSALGQNLITVPHPENTSPFRLILTSLGWWNKSKLEIPMITALLRTSMNVQYTRSSLSKHYIFVHHLQLV